MFLRTLKALGLGGAKSSRIVLIGLLLTLWSTSSAVEYVPSRLTPPKAAREYRAAWIATVANIDWPSTNTLTTAQQKAELLAIMDRAAQLKLNTLILQVRPGCDALYASTLEPWSEYLTGTMGKPPEPFYDPLAFAVEEAHKRGLELHAWFNPYRARHNSAKSPIAPNHISKTKPNSVRHYGKFLWLDPGEKSVQEHSLKVVIDVLDRYDIDGIHFDDYFYPYKEKTAAGREIDFPDDPSWKRYAAAGGKLSRDDWRRENVNLFLERVYKTIKARKPWVKFGISPFGIWRPGFPAQIKGFDAYDKLYADSRKWLAKGWLDYCAPQLYWGINPPAQSFPVLLQWWAEQNSKDRHLIPGLNTTRIGGQWQPDEIINQIRVTRKQAGSGHIHWNMKSLMRHPALNAALQREVYSEPALVPAAPWLHRTKPRKPQLTVSPATGCLKVQWATAAGAEKASRWVIQARRGQHWSTEVLPATRTTVELSGPAPEALAVTAVDRYGNASSPAVLERKK